MKAPIKHIDLFSGIGGFALAVESVWGGTEHIFCDNDPFAQAVLRKHWPKAYIHGDIKTLTRKETGPADIVTGGFPCQPFSSAGKRRGTEDDRHLWPEMLRVIRETAPRWVIGENVGGLVTWNGGMVLDEVFAGLEAEGYEVWAFIIPACAVGAPHRRDRVWITAHRSSKRIKGREVPVRQGRSLETSADSNRSINNAPDTSSIESGQSTKRKGRKDPTRGDSQIRIPTDTQGVGQRGRGGKECGKPQRIILSSKRQGGEVRSEAQGCDRRTWSKDWPEVAARLCTLDDGLPDGSPRPRGWRNAALKGAGNAIVPQVAEMIMRHIKAIDHDWIH